IAALAASKDPADQLLAAALYEDFEVHDEALALYEKAALSRPDEPHLLLARIGLCGKAGDTAKADRLQKRLLGLNPEAGVLLALHRTQVGLGREDRAGEVEKALAWVGVWAGDDDDRNEGVAMVLQAGASATVQRGERAA